MTSPTQSWNTAEKIEKQLKLLDDLDALRITVINEGSKDDGEGIQLYINQQLDILKIEGLEEIQVNKGDQFDHKQHITAIRTISFIIKRGNNQGKICNNCADYEREIGRSMQLR